MLSFFRRPASGTTQKRMPVPLRFHNTLSNMLEEFTPSSGREVKMYNCGPTPYDEQHIGNMVPALLGNLLRGSLEAWGYTVAQVTNITDFGHLSGDNEGNADIGEDRMSRGLKREGWSFTMENMRKLAEKYTEIFLRDIKSLGVPTEKIPFPRASEYVKEEIALVDALFQKGYAYKITDGIYYDTTKFNGYGKLGGLSGGPTEARVDTNAEKRNTRDFALWKFAEGENKLGWESPWGKGFPGWHIECTAMIFALLGKQIDIHTGGIEHIPVHHNNEIAQAEAITGKPYVRYWLHNAHITIEGKKISKSLGNTVYLHNIVDRGLDPLSLRYWFLTGHYRTPMNFTWEALEGAAKALTRLTRAFLEMPEGERDAVFLEKFYTAIANDLGTAQALALVWEHLPNLNKTTLREADTILGLGLAHGRPMQKLTVVAEADLPEDVVALVQEREEARKNKDFTKADELRTKIEARGFELTDTPKGAAVTPKQ